MVCTLQSRAIISTYQGIVARRSIARLGFAATPVIQDPLNRPEQELAPDRTSAPHLLTNEVRGARKLQNRRVLNAQRKTEMLVTRLLTPPAMICTSRGRTTRISQTPNKDLRFEPNRNDLKRLNLPSMLPTYSHPSHNTIPNYCLISFNST
ncbi:MAG: hypothetical protein FJZ49_00370 [Candidatus Verstraetearchaeota archaeon]|nr:hypothetical protein [Candidatus Verstraetearchaeota archaeon]